MKVKKIDDFPIYKGANVQLKKTGNIQTIRYMQKKAKTNIKKIDKHNYVDLSTGELKGFANKATTRADNQESAKHTFQKLRDIINANITRPRKCKFLTLTYQENMTDEKRLTRDLTNFYKRFKTYCKNQKIEYPEYISVIEPQGRGAFHAHIILVYQKEAPFLPNNDICQLWRQGFTETKAVKGVVNNVGVYLTAYFTDLPFDEVQDIRMLDHAKGSDLKTVKTTDENGNKLPKAIVKGLRLTMYPAGMQIFRCSKGIKKPEITECTYAEARQSVGNSRLTYTSCKELISSETQQTVNKIKYEHYNSYVPPKKRQNKNSRVAQYCTAFIINYIWLVTSSSYQSTHIRLSCCGCTSNYIYSTPKLYVKGSYFC